MPSLPGPGFRQRSSAIWTARSSGGWLSILLLHGGAARLVVAVELADRAHRDPDRRRVADHRDVVPDVCRREDEIARLHLDLLAILELPGLRALGDEPPLIGDVVVGVVRVTRRLADDDAARPVRLHDLMCPRRRALLLL